MSTSDDSTSPNGMKTSPADKKVPASQDNISPTSLTTGLSGHFIAQLAGQVGSQIGRETIDAMLTQKPAKPVPPTLSAVMLQQEEAERVMLEQAELNEAEANDRPKRRDSVPDSTPGTLSEAPDDKKTSMFRDAASPVAFLAAAVTGAILNPPTTLPRVIRELGEANKRAEQRASLHGPTRSTMLEDPDLFQGPTRSTVLENPDLFQGPTRSDMVVEGSPNADEGLAATTVRSAMFPQGQDWQNLQVPKPEQAEEPMTLADIGTMTPPPLPTSSPAGKGVAAPGTKPKSGSMAK